MMARENLYFSLTNASEIAQMHRPEVTLPGVRKAKNFYVSRSDNNLTLRGDMFRYRDDIYTIQPRWTDADSSTNTDDYLNMVITTGDISSDIFVNRLSPMRAGNATPICSTYTTGTITTDGSSSIVTGASTLWLQNVWPHCFIEFAGSTNLYRISRVDTNTVLVVEGTPPALSGVAYIVYRVHDSDRALYPMHFEMFGQQYLYGASEPNEPDAADQLSTSGPFYLKRQDAASPVILNGPTNPHRAGLQRCRYLNSKFWIVGTGCILESSDGTIWNDRTPPFLPYGSGNYALYDIAWSGTTYMVVGQAIPNPGSSWINPLIMTSTDGINWNWVTPSGAYLDIGITFNNSVAYGDGKFVIANLHAIYTTIDGGVTLTMRTNPLANGFQEVIFENSQFVGFSLGSGVATSPDGITWTAHTGAIGSGFPFIESIWDGANYLSPGMLSSNIRTETSADGITWVAGTALNMAGTGVSVAYKSSGPVYVLSTYTTDVATGHIYSSSDGITWILRKSLGLYEYASALACDGTTFVGGTNSGRIYTSTDGITWADVSATSYTTIYGSYLDEVTVGASTTYHTWFLCDAGALIKDKAQLIGAGISTTWRDMVRCVDHLTVVGDDGKIATSVDGILWTEQTSTVATDLFSIDYDSTGDVLVAVGETGTVVTSADGGYTWIDQTEGGMTKNLYGIAWDGTLFIAVGEDGRIQTSETGASASWIDLTSEGPGTDLNAVYATASLALTVGAGGEIYSSIDPSWEWTAETSGTSVALNAITKSGSRWLAAGNSGTVRGSTDGTTWTTVTSGVTSNINTVVYDGTSYSYLAYGKIIVRIPPSVSDAVFYPISDVYRSSALAVVGGYVILLGTSEWKNNNWTYWPRRLRWTSPGTFNDFAGYASGAQDIPGSGYIVDARTLQNNVILFESQRIGVYSFTGDIELPFIYRVISEGLFPISNPVIVDEICYFISGQGLLYGTNGVTVDKAPGLFDLTEYVDIYDGHPVFLVFNRYTRSLLVYKYDAAAIEHKLFSINPESGAYTSIILNQPSSENHPRSLVEFVTAYAPIAQDPGIPHDGGGDGDDPPGAPIYIDMAIIGSAQSATSMIVVDDYGYVYRSVDGTMWKSQFLAGGNVLLNGGIVYDDTTTTYIVGGQSLDATGGDGPCVWYSTDDGLTWTQSIAIVAAKDTRSLYGIGGVCIIGTDGGDSYSTADFSSWTTGTTGVEGVTEINRIWYDTNWIAATGDNKILYSAAGIVWSEASIDSAPGSAIFSFSSHNSKIYATTNNADAELLSSDDGGETWITEAHPAAGTTMNLNKCYSFGGAYLYLYGGDTSAVSGIYYSADVSTWRLTSSTLFDPNRSGSSNGGLHGYEGLIRFGVTGKTYIFGDKWMT